MKRTQVIILAGVLVAGVGVAIYTSKKRNAEITSGSSDVGEAVLKGFEPSDVSSMTINDGKHNVTVELKDGKWIVPARDAFPASLTAVNELRDNAFALHIAAVQKVGDTQLGRLKLKEPAAGVPEEEQGTLVSFRGEGGKEMSSIVIGKRLEDKQENTFSMTPQAPKAQYVKVAGDKGVVYQARDGFSKLEADPKGWLDKEKFFKVEKHKSVTVTGPTPAESWKIVRETDGGELKLDAPQTGEEFDKDKASTIGSVFSYISFDDILPAAQKEKAALDKPTHTAVIETFDGLTYTVKVGAKVAAEPVAVTDPKNPPPTPPESYYIAYAVDGKLNETPPPPPPAPTAPAEPAADAKPEDKTKFEDAKKQHTTAMETWEKSKKSAEESFKNQLVAKKDKLAAEQAQKDRIFVVPKSSLDPIMKKRTEFMKDKPATPATGTTPATGSNAAANIVPNLTGTTPPAGTRSPGRIEATTPPIEVNIPPKAPDAKAGKGTEEPKKDEPAKSDPKKPGKKKPK